MWGLIDVPCLNNGRYISKRKFNTFEIETNKKNIFDVKKNQFVIGFRLIGKNEVSFFSTSGTHARAHTYARTHANILTHKHAKLRAIAHKRIQTHINTSTHTHIRNFLNHFSE